MSSQLNGSITGNQVDLSDFALTVPTADGLTNHWIPTRITISPSEDDTETGLWRLPGASLKCDYIVTTNNEEATRLREDVGKAGKSQFKVLINGNEASHEELVQLLIDAVDVSTRLAKTTEIESIWHPKWPLGSSDNTLWREHEPERVTKLPGTPHVPKTHGLQVWCEAGWERGEDGGERKKEAPYTANMTFSVELAKSHTTHVVAPAHLD